MLPRKATVALSFLFFFFFIFFSYLVAKERFVAWDFDTTVRLQDHISRRWDLLFSLFSLVGSAEVTGIVWLGLVIYTLLKRFWLTVLFLGLFPASLLIELFGKIFVLHPAPPYLFYRGVLPFNFPSHYVHTDYSYPSGHLTRTAFLVAFLFFWLYYKVSFTKRVIIQAGLLMFLVIMMISRIYLGEHWTTDVIGGTLSGGSLGILAAATIPLKKKAKEVLHNLAGSDGR